MAMAARRAAPSSVRGPWRKTRRGISISAMRDVYGESRLPESFPAVTVSFLSGTDLLYAGPAPGLVAGVIQINDQAPSKLYCAPDGLCPDPRALPVIITVNGTYNSVVAAEVAIAY